MRSLPQVQYTWLVIAAASLLCACASASVEKPASATGSDGPAPEGRSPAPSGFSWREIPDIKAFFLMPDGWHYLEAVKGNTFGFYMTREEIRGEGTIGTGLSVNVIRSDGSTDAVEGARLFVGRMIDRNEELDSWTIEDGPFQGFGCRTRNASPTGDVTYITQTLAFGNTSTNTVYYMWFESREETWPEAWQFGETMLDQFVLDDSY